MPPPFTRLDLSDTGIRGWIKPNGARLYHYIYSGRSLCRQLSDLQPFTPRRPPLNELCRVCLRRVRQQVSVALLPINTWQGVGWIQSGQKGERLVDQLRRGGLRETDLSHAILVWEIRYENAVADEDVDAQQRASDRLTRLRADRQDTRDAIWRHLQELDKLRASASPAA